MKKPTRDIASTIIDALYFASFCVLVLLVANALIGGGA